MAGGRPPLYDTEEELQEAIDRYFDSCYAPLEDGLDPETPRDLIKPLTITGLAVSLGMCRDTLLNYQKKEQFFDTIKRAKEIIHAWTEEQLYRGGQVTGVIFNLKNNYGWVDKQEVDNTTTLKVVRKTYKEGGKDE